MEKRNPVEIVPAILPRDFSEITEKVELVKGLVKTVQIDICDGHFVSSFTWPYKKHDNSFEKMLHEEDGLPDWQDIDYEFDLMVDDPENVVDDWVIIGATRIILHAEAKGDVAGAIKKIVGKVEIGLALNVDTSADIIDEIVSRGGQIDFIQLMGIDHIGYQGQAFDERVIDKIKAVKKKYPDMPISIDGGVSLNNAGTLTNASADRLIVGSAIFESENPIEAVLKFKDL
jgi:ribulose-phosphate 3-epimerase